MYALLELYGKSGDTIIDALESDELYESESDSYESESSESSELFNEVVELVGDSFFRDFLLPDGNDSFSRTAAIYYIEQRRIEHIMSINQFTKRNVGRKLDRCTYTSLICWV
jgi:hypothetical protein